MAHSDLDALVDYCIGFAKQQLSKHGSFHPFGASVKADGNPAADGILLDDEHPPAQKVIDTYTEIYQSQAKAGELRAAALCWDSRVSLGDSPKTDAIAIGLEHSNGESVTVYLPYKKQLFRGYQYGELSPTRREPKFFQ
jgi:hypothetical protein